MLQDVLQRLARAYQAIFLLVRTGAAPGSPPLPRGRSVRLADVQAVWLGAGPHAGSPRAEADAHPPGHRQFSAVLVPRARRPARRRLERCPSVAGLDLGLESFLTLSDGTTERHVANPRPLRHAQAGVRTTQRVASAALLNPPKPNAWPFTHATSRPSTCRRKCSAPRRMAVMVMVVVRRCLAGRERRSLALAGGARDDAKRRSWPRPSSPCRRAAGGRRRPR